MTNSSHENLIAGYVLGNLTTEEVAEFQQLLALEPEMLSEVDQLQEVLAMLPLALPEEYPHPKLKDQILLKAFASDPEVDAEAPTQINKKPNHFPFVWPALATLLVALVGFDSYRTRQRLAIAQQELSSYQQAIAVLKQPNNRILSLKSTTKASGSLIIGAGTQSGILTIQNLPTPPQNMYYCLWALVDGKKAYIAEFYPDANGVVVLKFPIKSTLVNAKSVAITLEPKTTMPEARGKMVMQSELFL